MEQQQAQTIGDETRTLEPRAKAAAQGAYVCPYICVPIRRLLHKVLV